MTIDRSLLHQIAHLARIEVNSHSEAAMLDSLNEIIAWMKKLEEVDTSGVSPLATMGSAYNVFQEDVPLASTVCESVLSSPPNKNFDYFRVPQVKE